jgi:hypothetical protein
MAIETILQPFTLETRVVCTQGLYPLKRATQITSWYDMGGIFIAIGLRIHTKCTNLRLASESPSM